MMGSQQRLDHLYLLTVADIAATSPKLWNSWKSGMLRELYLRCTEVLKGGVQPDREAQQASTRQQVLASLLAEGLERSDVLKIWKWLPSSTFQRYSAAQLKWVTNYLVATGDGNGVVVSIRARPELSISEALVCAPDYIGLFAATTAVFDEMGLNVLSARVLTARNERSFDLFQIMNAQGLPLNAEDSRLLQQKLESVLVSKQVREPRQAKLPRRLRPFASKPKIRFNTARGGTVTALELECTDRPGLLSQLAWAMVTCDIRIHDAMIATFGERVEDTFLVTDRLNRPLNEELRADLVIAINQRLSLQEG